MFQILQFFTVYMVLYYENEKALYFHLLGGIPKIAKETFSPFKYLFFG